MNAPTTLPDTLRQARKATRLSQLELSLRMGVSQRHMSFVESGRARPSRELLLAWLQELDAPLAVRNAAMLQAGFAPVYGAAPLGDPALAQADEAIAHLLHAHDPMPALVLDAEWNLLRMNRGGTLAGATLMPWAAEPAAGTPVNMLDLLAHPEGFTRRIVNLREVGPALLAHLRARSGGAAAARAAGGGASRRCCAIGSAAGAHAGGRPGAPGPHHAVRHAARRAGVLQHVHDLRHAAGHHAGVAARRAHVRGRCGDSRDPASGRSGWSQYRRLKPHPWRAIHPGWMYRGAA